MRYLGLAGLVLCTSPAFSLDLAGAGEDPGLHSSSWWLTWGNDYQGNAPAISSDDFRTNRFDLGLRLGAWQLALDWSNFTARAPNRTDPVWGAEDPHAASRQGAGRIDELTASVLYRWGSLGPTGRWLALGPALRIDGRLGGSDLQKSVHTSTATHAVVLPYERDSLGFTPGMAAQGGLGTDILGPWMIQGRGAFLATTRAEVGAEASLRTGLASGASAVWIGPLYALREGSAGTRIARITADHERGWWLVAGIETPGLVLSVGNQLAGEDAVEGRITVRSVDDRAAVSPWPAEAEAGVIPWGNQPRANEWTLRVLVGLPSEDPWWSRLRVTLEGLRGELDLPNTYDMSGTIRRVLGGVQYAAWPTPATGPVFQPYVGVAAGIQRTEVHNEDSYGYTQEDLLRTAVFSQEIGVRLGWSAREWRSGVTASWAWVEVDRERRVPWATPRDAGETVLADDGAEGHLRWWVALGW